MKRHSVQGIMLAAFLSAAVSPVLAQKGHERGGQHQRDQQFSNRARPEENRQRDFSQQQRQQNVQRNNERQRDWQQKQPGQELQRANENRQGGWQQRQQAQNQQWPRDMQRTPDRQPEWQQKQQPENSQRNTTARRQDWPERQQSIGNQRSRDRSFDNKQFEVRKRQENAYKQARNYRVYAHNYRPQYSRPPVIWQGRRYYSFYNYNYHPYRPYYYGSFFHPTGFIRASLGALSINISFGGQPYWYDQGVFYTPYNSGYRVVTPPRGIYINQLPIGYNTVALDGNVYYYFAGIFYASGPQGYYVITAPPGAVVYDLPEGCTEIDAGDMTYLQYNNTVFQPIEVDGRNAWEVVELEDEGE
jgi:hypothetical protein